MTDELRIVMGGLRDDIWISDNAFRNAGGTSIGVTLWGLGETLTRVSQTGDVVPWLARSVYDVDPLTWRVELRQNATFWDGAPVTAPRVVESFARSLEVQKDVGLMLSADTRAREVDTWTVEFTTPEPTGHFAAALAHPQLIIHSSDGACMTGPYRPIDYKPDRILRLEAYDKHWSSTPFVPRICVIVIPDFEARVRSLKSGEADLIYAYPPEHVDQLPQLQDAYEVASWPSMRMHSLQLNCMRPPFNDVAVRRAASLAIDREGLITDVLQGHGAAACSLIPPWSSAGRRCLGPDIPDAERLLESSGWKMGNDGVRHRGDQRLEFTLYTPTGEVLAMHALATRLAEQLEPLGYAITPEEVPSLTGAVKNGTYTAAVRTGYSQLTGDPYFWMKLWLSRDGRANPGPSYLNSDLDALLHEYPRELQPVRRQELRHQLDALVSVEVPHVFLLFVPLILVARRGTLPEFVSDPNNEYFIRGGAHG